MLELINNIRIPVSISFEDILTNLDKFSLEQKLRMFNQLRTTTFREGIEKLSKEIVSPKFSDEEIMREVKVVRKKMYARKK